MPNFFTVGFRADENDRIYPTFQPSQFSSERDAVAAARDLARTHVGVLSWSQPLEGGRDEIPHPMVLYRQGRIRSPF